LGRLQEALSRKKKKENGKLRHYTQLPNSTPLDSKSLDAAHYKLHQFNKLCHRIKCCATQVYNTEKVIRCSEMLLLKWVM